MTHAITLRNTQQARETLASAWEWIKRRTSEGKPVRLTLAEEPRSLPQNDRMQAVVRELGRSLGYSDHDRLRALLVEQWRHETERKPIHVSSLDGQRLVDVSLRTSAMDKAEASEFLEWLEAQR